MGLFSSKAEAAAAPDDKAERGISSARQRELLKAAAADEAIERAVAADPISQDDHRQWQRASAPEMPPAAPQWRPSPGIEAMNRMFPSSQPLTREQAPRQPIGVTAAEWREIARSKFGVRAFFWMTPQMKREMAEECYLLPEFVAEPLPLPTSPTSHAELVMSRRKVAPAQPSERKPRHGTTFFTAALPTDDQQPKKPRRTFFSG